MFPMMVRRPRLVKLRKQDCRYEFDVNQLLFIKLLTEFPFSLPKEDKDSLRQLVGKSSGSAGRWLMRGPDLMMKKGELSVSVHFHPLRKQLVQNVNLYRKGSIGLSPILKSSAESPPLREPGYPWSTSPACSERR